MWTRRRDHETDSLIKQKKDKKKQNNTKRNDIAATTDAFVFYQVWGLSPFVSDALQNWLNDMGEDLVLDAMKRALERESRDSAAEREEMEKMLAAYRSGKEVHVG